MKPVGYHNVGQLNKAPDYFGQHCVTVQENSVWTVVPI